MPRKTKLVQNNPLSTARIPYRQKCSSTRCDVRMFDGWTVSSSWRRIFSSIAQAINPNPLLLPVSGRIKMSTPRASFSCTKAKRVCWGIGPIQGKWKKLNVVPKKSGLKSCTWKPQGQTPKPRGYWVNWQNLKNKTKKSSETIWF